MNESITLRDYLASNAGEKDIEHHREYFTNVHGEKMYTINREQARYRYADAMIKARDKVNENSR